MGGGIAGASLATVMARSGARVVVLERQVQFQDHVRGEIMWNWGARIARQLDLEAVLLGAGGQFVRWVDFYDEGQVESTRFDSAAPVPGIRGSINVSHPRACAALLCAAAAAEGTVYTKVRDVRVTTGEPPSVRWVDDDGEHHAQPMLVVGADGRRSTVRSQAGIAFEVDPPPHLIAGMVAEGIDGIDDDVNVIAREADLLFLSLPQGGGRARLYLICPTDQRSRFSGRDGALQFLGQAGGLRCLEGIAEWQTARPAGPCATFTSEDSRAHPLAEGVVLIGDAAGYENPLQGQGLSMTMHDVSDVSAALLGSSRSTDLNAYAAARAIRQRFAKYGTQLEIMANAGFVVQDPAERADRYARIAQDPVLQAVSDSYAAGFDALPANLNDTEFDRRMAAALN